MKVAILAIGDELTTGAVTDENSGWISSRLMEIGAETTLHLTVADEIGAIVDAYQLAAQRGEQIIVTGGLGPTEDDLTRDAVCKLKGVGTVENKPALDRLREIFRMIGRELTPNNNKQAMIPEGAELIPNPIGTAPGFRIEMNGAMFHFVPGVPRECKLMIEGTVLPWLAARGSGEVFRVKMFRTFGMTESQLDQELKTVPLPAGVKLCYRAIFPEIHLKLIARAGSKAGTENILREAADKVRAKVGAVIYSDDGRALEQVLLDAMRERKMKLATAESCTGGLIAKRLTDIPGSSDVFDRGFITYSNRAKIETLGVSEDIIKKHGAVHSETAQAMAKGAREKSGADLAIAVTGIAGPTGGSAERPVGTVHIALADKDGVWENKFLFTRAERTFTRELTAQAALEIARRRVMGLPELKR